MMRHPILVVILMAVLGNMGVPSNAQTTPAASVTPSPGQSPQGDEGDEDRILGDLEKPFVPHWTGQLGLTYSTQPTQLSQGQQTEQLNLTGTYNITESGTYLSLEIAGGEMLLEGANTNFGEITTEGCLAMGVFLPTLSFSLEEGASALNSYSSILNLDFEVLDSLTVGPLVSGGLETHQGPASQIYPNASNPDSFLVVSTGDWNAGVEVSFVPWDFETLTLTGQQEIDVTFQTNGIDGNNVKYINQSDRIPSLTLETETTFCKDFQLVLSAQAGQEFYSAGTVFSPITGKTRTFTQPTVENFTGYTVGLLYNFQ